MRIVFRPRWHRGAVKGSLHSRIKGHIGVRCGFDRSYPVARRRRISTSSLHFVPKESTFFAGLALRPARNICSKAGLFPQRCAMLIVALIVETESGKQRF